MHNVKRHKNGIAGDETTHLPIVNTTRALSVNVSKLLEINSEYSLLAGISSTAKSRALLKSIDRPKRGTYARRGRVIDNRKFQQINLSLTDARVSATGITTC